MTVDDIGTLTSDETPQLHNDGRIGQRRGPRPFRVGEQELEPLRGAEEPVDAYVAVELHVGQARPGKRDDDHVVTQRGEGGTQGADVLFDPAEVRPVEVRDQEDLQSTGAPGSDQLVSIIITNHNYARFLASAIQSALDQRDVAVEVVVVDDGSTDGSAAVIAAFGNRIVSVLGPNGGQGAACNAGWQICRGDVVIFLDADDVLAPDIAARASKHMRADPALARVQFVLDVIDETGAATGATVPEQPLRLFAGNAVPLLARTPDDIVWQPTSGNAFARRALDEVLPMPEQPYRICADYFLSNLVPLHGGVVALTDSGGGYRVHGANSHWARRETLERLRANIVRTATTHELLWQEGRRLGFADWPNRADDLCSVTSLANRLLAYRIEPSGHPVLGDTRIRLAASGIGASRRRHDRSPIGRASIAAWFLAAASVPRPWLPMVARPYVRIERTRRQGRGLRLMRTRRSD